MYPKPVFKNFHQVPVEMVIVSFPYTAPVLLPSGEITSSLINLTFSFLIALSSNPKVLSNSTALSLAKFTTYGHFSLSTVESRSIFMEIGKGISEDSADLRRSEFASLINKFYLNVFW